MDRQLMGDKEAEMVDPTLEAPKATHRQIRERGAVSSLNGGIQMIAHGAPMRAIAWPGNGFQTLSLHMLILQPGEESEVYRYPMSEEGLLCLEGQGEVLVRDQWAMIEPGDIAFFPDDIPHGVRNPTGSDSDFVLVSVISPPPLDLYQSNGYYDAERKAIDFDRVERENREAPSANLSGNPDLAYHESHPELRAWNLSLEDVRRNGALFNFFTGARYGGLGGAMRLILWPGYGVTRAGLHTALAAVPGAGHSLPEQQVNAIESSSPHIHPISDEVVVIFKGGGQIYLHDRYIPAENYDCGLAPSGVKHTILPPLRDFREPWFAAGFACPPQPDIYIDSGYFRNGRFDQPPFEPYGKGDPGQPPQAPPG